MARVTCLLGGAPRSFELSGNLAVVGSDPSCTVVPTGGEASPIHCELRRGPDGWRVVDLESRAGTRVNGEFVNQRVLRDGDVVDVGGVALRFEGEAVSAPAAAPAPAAAAAAPPPVRRAPVVPVLPRRTKRTGGDDEDSWDEDEPEEPEERREQRFQRRANTTATTTMLVAAGLIGLLLVVWLLFKMNSETPNDRIRARIAAAERDLRWQEVIDLGGQAEDDGSHDYAEIRKIVARAKKALEGEAAGQRVDQSIADWNQVRVWRQENWTADEEYLAKIDAYLASYEGLGSEGVKQAKAERLRLTGTTATTAPESGEPAWKTLLEDLKVLEADGRFGDALAKIDAYQKAEGAHAQLRIAQVDAERRRLQDAAGKWFGKQVALAEHAFSNGEKRKAQRLLENAAKKIGLPGYDERAIEEMNRILSGR